MPVHDWSKMDAGIFHDFHHSWIEEIQRALNRRLLPNDHYAMVEQHVAESRRDSLTIPSMKDEEFDMSSVTAAMDSAGAVLFAPPQVAVVAESDVEFYRRKASAIVVRHVSGDRVAAIVEVVSSGNKSGRNAIRSFIEKAAELLDQRIHLLILDLHPPGPRDPQGIHGVIWEKITGQEYAAAADKPLTLAAYESALTVRAYVQPLAVGDRLTDMPLFLEPGAHVPVPLEATYKSAFAALPRRWRTVLEAE